MKSIAIKAKAFAYRHRHMLKAMPLALLVAFTVALIIPQPVYADAPNFDFFSPLTSLKNFVCYFLLEGSAMLFNLYDGIVSNIGSSSMLTAPFDSLLGASTFNIATTIHQTVIVPIAESILALFMLVQLVKISQRIDATSTLPAVKDIVFLAVTYVLMHWLIINSLELLQSVYEIAVKDIIPQIGTASPGNSIFEEQLSTDVIKQETWDALSIGACLVTFFVSFLSVLGGAISYCIAFVVAYARAWQIYALAAFSAIPMALMGFEETKQMAIGFLKNFAAAVLAGAIMMFLLVIYPSVLTALSVNSLPHSDIPILFLLTAQAAGAGAGVTYILSISSALAILEWLAVTVLLALGLIKSGTWAKELLGS